MKSFILLFIAIFHYNYIADNKNNADYNVSDKEIIHNFYLGKSLSPSARVRIAKIIPAEKVSILKFSPATPGAKMETKVEPTSSFDKSIIYSEVFSSWGLVNFIALIIITKRAGDRQADALTPGNQRTPQYGKIKEGIQGKSPFSPLC